MKIKALTETVHELGAARDNGWRAARVMAVSVGLLFVLIFLLQLAA